MGPAVSAQPGGRSGLGCVPVSLLRWGTIGAQPDEIDAVVGPEETAGACHEDQLVVKPLLEILTQSDIENGATCGAHEVMVVASGDVFCQLEVGVVLTGDDPMDDVRLFENGEVPIRRTLSEARSILQQLHDGLRVGFAVKGFDDLAAALCVPLAR